MRIYRAIWLPIALVLGVCGSYLIAARQPIPVLVVGVAGVSLTVVGLHLRHPDWSWSRVPPKILRYAVVAAAIWSYLGLIRLLGVYGGLVVLVVVALSPPVLTWATRAVRRTGLGPSRSAASASIRGTSDAHPEPAVELAIEALPDVLAEVDFSQVSDADLCRIWRTSFVELQQLQLLHAVAAQLQLVTARQGCLDELERRDPDGFRRWLAAGARPAGDPSRYIGPSTPLPTDGVLP